jgi:hypothetical protein
VVLEKKNDFFFHRKGGSLIKRKNWQQQTKIHPIKIEIHAESYLLKLAKSISHMSFKIINNKKYENHVVAKTI